MGLQLTHQQTKTLPQGHALLGVCRRAEVTQAFGFRFPLASLSHVASDITNRALFGFKTRIAFVNAHCINEMKRSASYERAVRNADMILPDGSGIALSTFLNTGRCCTNLNGTDLAPQILQDAQKKNLSVFLLGARPGVALATAKNLRKQFPRLKIAGVRHGYFNDAENDAVIEIINAAKPDLLFVAMGVPRQELWLAENADRLSATVMLGVGGLFDFLSERIPRAPLFLRRAGLEWTYRLYQEPKRMARRYILGNPLFVVHALADAAKGRGALLSQKIDSSARRLLDICGAAAGLMILSPILAAAMVAIKLESPGAALFRQKRIGKNGAPFIMYKFRSMVNDAEALRGKLSSENHHGADAVTFKLSDDPRITPVGKFIRKYSIDELPQLWNVLTGKMSLVGPRPALPDEVSRYSPTERKRLDVKPGITCLWQIEGRANIDFKGQVDLDIQYIEQRNVFQNLWILLRTPGAVLTARGAY